MSSSRQPLLTLSPSQHGCVGSPTSEERSRSPQTTPKLSRRERLASFSRLLKKKIHAENVSRSNGLSSQGRLRALQEPASVDIRISPCSPDRTDPLQTDDDEDKSLESGKEYLSPNRLPFSPRLLNRKSPANLSPSYRRPSPLRSPLYTPDGRRNYLGRGSFGKVSLCKYEDRSFAVKVSHQSLHCIGEKNLLGVHHPHLVEIYYISTVLDRTLIFMEFAGHCNLQQILDTKSELDFRRKLSFCIQIASGLRHCHQKGIVHGDVKPANVMVSPLGVCKLGDFGNSSVAAAKGPSPEDFFGTVAYAAPEVLRGSQPRAPSDVYSYGIVLWQMESREMPFAGEHPHVIIYKVANYGEKPEFSGEFNDADPGLPLYVETAEKCMTSSAEDRIDIAQVLSRLQDIMQKIKHFNGG